MHQIKIVFLLLVLEFAIGQTEPNFEGLFNSNELHNERSLSKGNGAIKNGNIFVSEFSGSLNYRYPIFSKKIGTESNIDISMVYNSNLSAFSTNYYEKDGEFFIDHMAAPSSRSHTGTSQINVPGWILNVNGVAVQVLNWEKNIYTRLLPSNTDENGFVFGPDLKRLLKGWHVNFVKERFSNGNQVKQSYSIQIINGDGGIDVYKMGTFYAAPSLDYNPGHTLYLYNQNRDGSLAKLSSTYGSKYSRLEIEYPDGKTVTYQMYSGDVEPIDIRNEFETVDPTNGVDDDLEEEQVENYSHMTLLQPLTIRYADGGYISFIYSDNNHMVRDLEQIVVNGHTIRLEYETDQFSVLIDNDRRYEFKYLENTAYNLDNKHAQINSITDPLGNETHIEYEDYTIKNTGLYGSTTTAEDLEDENAFYLHFATKIKHELKRISLIQQPYGEKHVFEYLQSDAAIENNGTSISAFATQAGAGLQDQSPSYYMTGREFYGSNTIKTHKVTDSADNLKNLYYFYYSAYDLQALAGTYFSKRMIDDDSEVYTFIYEMDDDESNNYISNYYSMLTLNGSDRDERVDDLVEIAEPNVFRKLSVKIYTKYDTKHDDSFAASSLAPTGAETKLIGEREYSSASINSLLFDRSIAYDLGQDSEAWTSSRGSYKAWDGSFQITNDIKVSYKDGKAQTSSVTNQYTFATVHEENEPEKILFRYPLQIISEDHLHNKTTTVYDQSFMKTTVDDAITSHDKMKVVPQYTVSERPVGADIHKTYQVFEYVKAPEPKFHTVRINTIWCYYRPSGDPLTNYGIPISPFYYYYYQPVGADNGWLHVDFEPYPYPLKRQEFTAAGWNQDEWKMVTLRYPDGKQWWIPNGASTSHPFDNIQSKTAEYRNGLTYKTGIVYYIPGVDRQRSYRTGFITQLPENATPGNQLYEFSLNVMPEDDAQTIQFEYAILDAADQTVIDNRDVLNPDLTTVFTGFSSQIASIVNGKVTLTVNVSSAQLQNAIDYGILILPKDQGYFSASISDASLELTNNYKNSLPHSPNDMTDTENYSILSPLLTEMLPTTFAPGQVVRKLTAHYINDSFKYSTIDGLYKYDGYLISKIIDSQGNKTTFNSISTNKTVKKYYNGEYKSSVTYNFPTEKFSPTAITKYYPTATTTHMAVRFHPKNGKPVQVLNPQGLDVIYSYDELDRIRYIFTPNSFLGVDNSSAPIRYEYDDANNVINYYKTTGEKESSSTHKTLKSIYYYDDFNRFERQKSYEDYAATISRESHVEYEFDNQLSKAFDVEGHYSLTNYNSERRPIYTRMYKSDNSQVAFIYSDFEFLTKSEFLAEIDALYSDYSLSGVYPAASLPSDGLDNYVKMISCDENGTISWTYKGPEEKLLVSVANAAHVPDYHSIADFSVKPTMNPSAFEEKSIVIYEYDDKNNLVWVQHPNAVNLTNGARIDELSTHYIYDVIYNTLTSKKIPDQGLSEYLYDQFGRLRYMRDANMTAAHQFVFYGYDQLGRQIYTGLCTDNSSDTQWNGLTALSTVNRHAALAFETDHLNYLTYTQYDKSPSFTGAFSEFATASLPTISTEFMVGAATYTATRENTSSTWNYYWTELDVFGRATVAYAYEKGSLNKTVYTYDSMNRIKTQMKEIFYNTVSLFKDVYSFNYDIMGRLKNVYRNGKEEIAKDYDQKDRIIYTRLAAELQEMSYTYNYRGWLKSINDVDNLQSKQIFAMKLNYWDNPFVADQVYYNGNISSSVTNSTASVDSKLQFSYGYDSLNRLKTAYSYYVLRSNWYDASYSYDVMGNMLSVKRKGGKE